MNYKEIGENIRIYRNKKKITQQELADRIGVTWEMVSRYERGVSSPMQKIDNISKALSIKPKDLFEPYNTENIPRRLPLFTFIPKDFNFSKENSRYYYSCPDWIYELDNKCFALDSNIVTSRTFDIKNNGVLYIVNKDASNSSVYLNKEDGKLVATKEYSNNTIGKIVAEEVRI